MNEKKTTNPAMLDKLSDICGHMDSVYAMLDLIREECALDKRICDAIFGAESLVQHVGESLDAFRAEFEKAVAV